MLLYFPRLGLACNSKRAIKEILFSKYYLEVKQELWENGKFDLESVKETDCSITIYYRDICCSYIACSLYSLSSWSLMSLNS